MPKKHVPAVGNSNRKPVGAKQYRRAMFCFRRPVFEENDISPSSKAACFEASVATSSSSVASPRLPPTIFTASPPRAQAFKLVFWDEENGARRGASFPMLEVIDGKFLSGANLDLSDENGGDTIIEKALQPHANLASIVLCHCRIGPKGAAKIAEALRKNGLITHLDLTGNWLKVEGAKIIATAISNSSLLSLLLGGNEIGDEGCQAIAQAMEANQKLAMLDLALNNIGDTGAEALAQVFATNSLIELSYLLLSDNDIHYQAAAKLEALLQQDTVPLRTLYLTNNPCLDEGFTPHVL